MKNTIPNCSFSNDKLLTDDVLKIAADMISNQIDEEILEHESRNIEIPEDFDGNLLKIVRDLDADRKAEKRRAHRRKSYRLVASFIVCFIFLGTITMGTSEAFRQKVFNLFSNPENGSVTFRNETEQDMLASWKSYWYPTYLPEDFVLMAADEKDHFLIYINGTTQSEISIYEIPSTSSISLDTDTTTIENIRVGLYDGYLAHNKISDEKSVMWLMETKTIIVDFVNIPDDDTILKIIENLEYVSK